VAVNIQIFGTRKDADTRAAERFFKERGIRPHFVDIRERAPSQGELENVARAVGRGELLDPESKAYRDRGFAYREFDPVEEAAADPLLLRLPIVRTGKEATVGYAPDTWRRWLAR
jgi:arsenate reductase-like glutaredoxin family protein